MVVKKTWLIDPKLVKKAQRVLGARTETETVTHALREMVIQAEMEKAFRRAAPVLANIEEVFPDSPRPRKRR